MTKALCRPKKLTWEDMILPGQAVNLRVMLLLMALNLNGLILGSGKAQ